MGHAKVILMTAIICFASILNVCLAQREPALKKGCALMDKTKDAQFISFENRVDISELKLRLRNNTDCSIILQTDDNYPTVVRKLPKGQLRLEQVVNSEDGVRLPLHYLVQRSWELLRPAYAWGDSSFSYEVSGGQSVVFDVPLRYFKRGYAVAVPFNYEWEGQNIGMVPGGVLHRVYFTGEDLPIGILGKKKSTTTR